jgi:hypothetical protein
MRGVGFQDTQRQRDNRRVGIKVTAIYGFHSHACTSWAHRN